MYLDKLCINDKHQLEMTSCKKKSNQLNTCDRIK